MPSPYATDEDYKSLWYERAVHVSTHLGAIAFGILIVVYYLALYHNLRKERISLRWIIFNTTIVTAGVINLATSIDFNKAAWIDERRYPGGPYAFLVEQQYRPIQIVGLAASIASIIMAQGLLLYRVFVIWENRWYIVIIPVLFFLASTALAILSIIQSALPSSPTWNHMPNFGFPVWMMMMVMNVTLTLLLAIRLLHLRRRLRTMMGAQYGKTYTSIAAILVESAVPFGILSIVFIVLFGKNASVQHLFLPLLVQVVCLSPVLITLRIIRGVAWTADTSPPPVLSTLVFTPGAPSANHDEPETRSLGEANEFYNISRHQSQSMENSANKPGSDLIHQRNNS